MSATDELRRLLDERGIEWWQMHDVEAGYYQDRDTEFVVDGKKYTAHEWGGRMTVYGLTPEQAIAATVGVDEDEADARDLLEAIKNDDGVRYSMDEVMEVVKRDAATVGNTMTLDEATEYAERFMGDYAKVLLESTLFMERDKPTDQHAFNIAERKEAQMARDLAEALATAGVGTCRNVSTTGNFRCSECDATDLDFDKPTYCHGCGRKVVDE